MRDGSPTADESVETAESTAINGSTLTSTPLPAAVVPTASTGMMTPMPVPFTGEATENAESNSWSEGTGTPTSNA